MNKWSALWIVPLVVVAFLVWLLTWPIAMIHQLAERIMAPG